MGNTAFSGTQLMLIAGPETPDAVVKAAILGGITALEIRGKEVPARRLIERGRDFLRMCTPAGISLIVNDRPDICRVIGAAGAHVGPDDLPPETAREVLGPDRLLGVSVRTQARLLLAERAHADYIGVGALRVTSTKPDTTAVGLAGIDAIKRETCIPVLAIGSVQPDDIPALREIGIEGVAVASGILEAPDPEHAARRYREALAAG